MIIITRTNRRTRQTITATLTDMVKMVVVEASVEPSVVLDTRSGVTSVGAHSVVVSH